MVKLQKRPNANSYFVTVDSEIVRSTKLSEGTELIWTIVDRKKKILQLEPIDGE